MVRTLLDTLRLGESPPDDLAGRWAALRLEHLPALIAYEGASIWLFRRLRALRILSTLDDGFRTRLTQEAFLLSARVLQVDDEAAAVIGLLQGARIPVVLIKGVARRALAVRYPYLDARTTSDVDLLLPEERILEAYALLRASGYESTPITSPPHHHHLPGLWTARRVPVELHRSTSVRIPPSVAWSRAMDQGEEVEWQGLRVRVPSATELAWAAVSHSINGSLGLGHRLQHFLELAALSVPDGAVRWELLAQRATSDEIFEEDTGVTYPPAIAQRWIHGALQCVRQTGPGQPHLPRVPLDLEMLLAWRLEVLGLRRRLGRALTERMLEEGPRTLVGWGPQPAPIGSPVVKRWRRRAAGELSRLVFRSWRRYNRRRATAFACCLLPVACSLFRMVAPS